jgi:hypothetical protein
MRYKMLYILWMCCLSLSGQDSLVFKGIVRDFRDEYPVRLLDSVHVFTSRDPKGTLTDSAGEFSLHVLRGDSIFIKKENYSFWSATVDDSFVDDYSGTSATVMLMHIKSLAVPGKLKEVIIDGHLYPSDILYSMAVDIEWWAVFYTPKKESICILQSKKNQKKGISPWILLEGKDTLNAVHFLRKREWGIDEK